jgi:hypothetical protein
MPVITEEGNTAGPSYHWTSEEDIDKPTKRPAFKTMQAYIQASLAESFTLSIRQLWRLYMREGILRI